MKRGEKGGKGIPILRGSGMVGLMPAPLAMVVAIFILVSAAQARDAAFIDPGSTGGAGADDAIKVEPKNDIDIGDSALNVARNTDVFFENQSGGPIKVEKVAVNGDGNVATEIVSDDCSKQGVIQSGTRCSVELSLTPSSPGPWSAELLLTHDGAGRIARAKLSGKTAGTASTEKKDMGLAINSKEATPVNFGDVDVDSGKVVRSALMVNDSNEPITLYSIDVIEASNGLQKLDQGCAVDMELKPGESCPVTLVWAPTDPGQVSTDLIIRHSGRLGFAVVPIRGVAKGTAKDSDDNASASAASSKSNIPPPPGAKELEKAEGDKIPPVSDSTLSNAVSAAKETPVGMLYLIGTVGNRAIILKPDGKTVVANSGDDFDVGSKQAKVVLVSAKSVDLLIDGKKRTLQLGAAPQIIERATLKDKAAAKKEKDFDSKDSDLPSGAASTTPGSTSAPTSGTVAGATPGAAMSGIGGSK